MRGGDLCGLNGGAPSKLVAAADAVSVEIDESRDTSRWLVHPVRAGAAVAVRPKGCGPGGTAVTRDAACLWNDSACAMGVAPPCALISAGAGASAGAGWGIDVGPDAVTGTACCGAAATTAMADAGAEAGAITLATTTGGAVAGAAALASTVVGACGAALATTVVGARGAVDVLAYTVVAT